MARSRTDGFDAGERREVHRHKLCPACGAEPQLSCRIVAPAPHGAISLDGQAMRASGGDGLRLGESTHRDRNIAGGRGAIPKLSTDIAAPGPGGAIGLDRDAVTGPTGDGGDVGQGAHMRGRGARRR